METMIDASTLERMHSISSIFYGVFLSSVGKLGGNGFRWRDINVATRTFSAHHFCADVYN